jgi:PPM family protein phosphatase
MNFERGTGLVIDYGSRTHLGGKKENQDFFKAFLDAEKDVYCFAIADGLGGYKAGRNAAQLAVESILDSFYSMDRATPGTWLHDALQEAHQLIKVRNTHNAPAGIMKTTCVVLALIRGRAYWASVGDSRIYVMRDETLLHRSKDHSVVQVLLDMGEIKPEEVRGHPDRNRILRVLGMDEDMKPMVNAEGLVLQRGDCLLLCTDGFWGCMEDNSILEYICIHKGMPAQELLDSMFKDMISGKLTMNNTECHDNISAQLILIK